MTPQAQQSYLAQQNAPYPRALTATGTFHALIDTIQVDFQTLTLVHDLDSAIYRLVDRHADNAVTVIKITIELPDTVRQGQVLDLSKWVSNKVNVWYAVKSPTIHYVVRCSEGTLVINNLQAGIVKISGALGGTTDEDVNGNTHALDINFDLTS